MKKTIEQLQDNLKLLGLISIATGEPLSFAGFKSRVTIHVYGKGKYANKIAFVGHPKQNMFGFYASFRGDKNNEVLQDAYANYKKIVQGDITPYDSKEVQWGNCGIPLGYGDLRSL